MVVVMIDGSKKRNHKLALELQSWCVIKRCSTKSVSAQRVNKINLSTKPMKFRVQKKEISTCLLMAHIPRKNLIRPRPSRFVV